MSSLVFSEGIVHPMEELLLSAALLLPSLRFCLPSPLIHARATFFRETSMWGRAIFYSGFPIPIKKAVLPSLKENRLIAAPDS
jgi:hypothetical protein